MSRETGILCTEDSRAASKMHSTASFFRPQTSITNKFGPSVQLLNHEGNSHLYVPRLLQYPSRDTGAQRWQRGRTPPPELVWVNPKARGRALGPWLRLPFHRRLTGHGISRRAVRCPLGSAFGERRCRKDPLKG